MSVLYIVLPIALVLVGVAVVAFVWAARRGQFDDMETPAIRALHEEPKQKQVVGPQTDAASERPAGGGA
ncbi:MAG TPA: cbb3-type cytochrome oxidase assembly protein CcoS [Candidatus Eisenbacteria bacterium]|nr:cbb3-type cytochrome oxidase assembly protein CcoS [Candidatus Eisenbacteria bacterium]